MFKNPSFLFDIICTAAWIILVVRYARKGFLSSIVQLVGNLFSLLGAKELSAACAALSTQQSRPGVEVHTFDHEFSIKHKAIRENPAVIF